MEGMNSPGVKHCGHDMRRFYIISGKRLVHLRECFGSEMLFALFIVLKGVGNNANIAKIGEEQISLAPVNSPAMLHHSEKKRGFHL